ncbi:hypothetical protein C2S53_005373 [Perilla frutescens var. hirtella]|uniref:Uncharacterized protein n=1 Tax=Perilla frutescens var. hirtella TaxID=608512 RepID=A0AAD4JHT8_PERFH|nr:hypothetical protein C2S53_005373 [Perilla frutescens var. hirtella]
MEGGTDQNQNRKRRRDDDDSDSPEIMVEAKKQESSYSYEQRRYEFHDGIGVFDFPWLKEKEGVIFNSSFQEIDHEEDNFAPSSYLDQENFNHSHDYDLEYADIIHDHTFCSLLVDDHDLDCIWSCVIDHPLDLNWF